MAREIAGKDQRKGKKEREDLGFGAGNSCSNGQRMEFYHCVLLFVCLFVCLFIYWTKKRKSLRLINWVKTIRTNFNVRG